MKLNPKNIFKLAGEKYPLHEPKPNGDIDPIYALFKRYLPAAPQQTMAFYTDTSICTGCKGCEIACKQWNQQTASQIKWSGDSYDNTRDLTYSDWRHVKFIERFPAENEKNRPAPANIDALLREKPAGRWLIQSDQCKHCEESPCHEACPTGAIMRNEWGGVYYQTDICMGCRMCIAACPFGVPELNPNTGHSMKCAECLDRMRDGLTPACALACTTGAIHFGPREEMLQKAYARLKTLHSNGHPEARLYGANAFDEYSSLNSFYLLMDNPEVYGLPVEPVTPVKYMPGDYLRAIATLIICAAAIAACV